MTFKDGQKVWVMFKTKDESSFVLSTIRNYFDGDNPSVEVWIGPFGTDFFSPIYLDKMDKLGKSIFQTKSCSDKLLEAAFHFGNEKNKSLMSHKINHKILDEIFEAVKNLKKAKKEECKARAEYLAFFGDKK